MAKNLEKTKREVLENISIKGLEGLSGEERNFLVKVSARGVLGNEAIKQAIRKYRASQGEQKQEEQCYGGDTRYNRLK